MAQSDGTLMHLYINGELEGSKRIYGRLRKPPRAIDGDLTLGCGMFRGETSDACQCLITEARVSESAHEMKSWLWRPKWRQLPHR